MRFPISPSRLHLWCCRKGYTTLTLTAAGDGGHSSMPPSNQYRYGHGHRPTPKNDPPHAWRGAVGYLQDYLAPEMPSGTKMAMANRWLLKSTIISMLAQSNPGNAPGAHHHCPHHSEAGVKDNVLPIEAIAKVNFRILPGDSVAGVIAHVKKAIDNERIAVESNPKFDTNPSPVSDTATLGFRLIHRTIKRCFPDVLVSPYLVLGVKLDRVFSARFRPMSTASCPCA